MRSSMHSNIGQSLLFSDVFCTFSVSRFFPFINFPSLFDILQHLQADLNKTHGGVHHFFQGPPPLHRAAPRSSIALRPHQLGSLAAPDPAPGAQRLPGSAVPGVVWGDLHPAGDLDQK